MYRYFIDQAKVSIRLAAFEESGGSFVPTRPEWQVRPNDPLYLMKGTSSPEPYDQQAAFDFLDEDELKIMSHGLTPMFTDKQFLNPCFIRVHLWPDSLRIL